MNILFLWWLKSWQSILFFGWIENWLRLFLLLFKLLITLMVGNLLWAFPHELTTLVPGSAVLQVVWSQGTTRVGSWGMRDDCRPTPDASTSRRTSTVRNAKIRETRQDSPRTASTLWILIGYSPPTSSNQEQLTSNSLIIIEVANYWWLHSST